jgi:hypothetical protein
MQRYMRSVLCLFAFELVACAAAEHGDRDKSGKSDDSALLPEVCDPDHTEMQSPALFGESGLEPARAETCDVVTGDWVPCHQHMHCGPEHSGNGICGGADCEVHTVFRQRKDGAAADPIADLHHGSVGGNCVPAEHHLMVRATFLDLDDGCAAGISSNLTYCGSATGNNKLDADNDGAVSCAESGVNSVPVRWCIQTACECRPDASIEELSHEFGEDEATREQGCSNES